VEAASVEAPSTLVEVSNGRLQKKTDLGNGFTRWDWHVSYPINNYDVSLNVGTYVHFDDTYTATWWPRRLPTLIISGADDRIVTQALWDNPRFQHDNVPVLIPDINLVADNHRGSPHGGKQVMNPIFFPRCRIQTMQESAEVGVK